MPEEFNLCFQPGFLRIVYMFKFLLEIIRFLVPIALIIKVSLDIYKGVINPNDQEVKKMIKDRIIAVIIIFIIPTVINLIMEFVNYTLAKDVYTGLSECWVWATPEYIDEMQSIYDEKLYQDYLTNEEQKKTAAEQAKLIIQRLNEATTLSVSIGEYANKSKNWIACGNGPSYNSGLFSDVRAAGLKTRNGAVAAATYLSSKVNVNIPYYFGGGRGSDIGGLSKNWGCTSGNSTYPLTGFDCSGFVSWSIMNGGYYTGNNSLNFSTVDFHAGNSAIKSNITLGGVGVSSVATKSANGTAKPGDLAWYYNHSKKAGHVGMIIKVDGDKYWVAEETGRANGIKVTERKFSSSTFTHIILMDNFYANYQKGASSWSGFNS